MGLLGRLFCSALLLLWVSCGQEPAFEENLSSLSNNEDSLENASDTDGNGTQQSADLNPEDDIADDGLVTTAGGNSSGDDGEEDSGGDQVNGNDLNDDDSQDSGGGSGGGSEVADTEDPDTPAPDPVEETISFDNTFAIRGAMQAEGHVISNEGTLFNNLATANAVCVQLGYERAKSHSASCPAYNGRTGYTSPHNNYLYKWQGASFVQENARDAGNTWLGQLVCVRYR